MSTIQPGTQTQLATIATPLTTSKVIHRVNGLGGTLLSRPVANVQEAVILGGLLIMDPTSGEFIVLIGDSLRRWLTSGAVVSRYECVYEWVIDSSHGGYKKTGRAANNARATNRWFLSPLGADVIYFGVVSAAESGFGMSHPEGVFGGRLMYGLHSETGVIQMNRGMVGLNVPTWTDTVRFDTGPAPVVQLPLGAWPAGGFLHVVTALPYFESFKTLMSQVYVTLRNGESRAIPYLDAAYPQIMNPILDYVPTVRSIYFWTQLGAYHGPGGLGEPIMQWSLGTTEFPGWAGEPIQHAAISFGLHDGYYSSAIEVAFRDVYSSYGSVVDPIGDGFVEDYRQVGTLYGVQELGVSRDTHGLPVVVEMTDMGAIPRLVPASHFIDDAALTLYRHVGTDTTILTGYMGANFSWAVPEIPRGLVGLVGNTSMVDLHRAALPGAYMNNDGSQKAGLRVASWEEFSFPALPAAEGYSLQTDPTAFLSIDAHYAAQQAAAQTNGLTVTYPPKVAWMGWGLDVFDNVQQVSEAIMDEAQRRASA